MTQIAPVHTLPRVWQGHISIDSRNGRWLSGEAEDGEAYYVQAGQIADES